MNELRLLFTRTGDTITYRIVASWRADDSEPQPFVPFLTADDHEDLRWYLEDFMDLPMGGAVVRAERVERALGEWGRKLFAAVFARGRDLALYEHLRDRGDGPRLMTIGAKDSEVLRLPWELMADAEGPLARQGIAIRRQSEAARGSTRYETGKLPLRILLVVSRPEDMGFIDPRQTTRAMLDALGPLGDGVAVDFCRPATLKRLKSMLVAASDAGWPYHIVHFDGHGTFVPEDEMGVLRFEHEGFGFGKVMSDQVCAARFGELVAAHRVPLVILEACRSGKVGRGGIAPRLLDAGAGSVLAMSHAVHVEATRVLLQRFYEELVAGTTIGQAVEQGRTAMMQQRTRWLGRGSDHDAIALQDWFLPTLYQEGADPVMVPRNAQAAAGPATVSAARRAPATGQEPGAFPDAPMYGLLGRAWELQRLERRFLHHRAVLLHGMGGMGKTSLAREAAFWGIRTGLFQDGACFVSFEQPGGAARAVRVLGWYLDGPDFEKRPAKEQKERARELFQSKRVLVVWDNFESVLPAFQGGEAVPPYPEEERAEIYEIFAEWTGDATALGRLLITCRPAEAGLRGAPGLELQGLARADALALLYDVMREVGVPDRRYDREALSGLLAALVDHPLSIELMGPHLARMGPEELLGDLRRLLGEIDGTAEVERNRSLKASLDFSLRRLSPAAMKAVRWLGLFRGGVFEEVLLDISEMDPAAWDAAREELSTTALLRLDRRIEVCGRHYLRFHPTLAYAMNDDEAAAGVKERYVEVYLAVTGALDESLRGSNPRRGADIMTREEANFRRAVKWALEMGMHDKASIMGERLSTFLQLEGRFRERDQLAAWLAGEICGSGFSAMSAAREVDAARALLNQGQGTEAIEKLEGLAARLRETTEFVPTFSLANVTDELGKFYAALGRPEEAISALEDAVRQWEVLIDTAQAAGESARTERGNLAATLGDLANALLTAGAIDAALTQANRAIAISRDRGDLRSIAAGLGRIAKIARMQGRYADADALYDDALRAAHRAGDRELEAVTLQNQGVLAHDRGQYDRAAALCQRGLLLFRDMHNEGAVMRTCNILGVVERNAGRLAEARAWYERAYEIASRRNDQQTLASTTHNLGIVCQVEGEAARQQNDEEKARERLTEALRFVNESLAIAVERQDAPGAATSHGQLAKVYILLGELDKAEHHAHHARAIRERLGLKEVYFDYDTLAAIAHARGRDADAAAWEGKHDAALAALDRHAGLSKDFIKAITRLALVCARAGRDGEQLEALAEDALATLATYRAPLATLAPFLRALAAGQALPVPACLPIELTEELTRVLEAVHE